MPAEALEWREGVLERALDAPLDLGTSVTHEAAQLQAVPMRPRIGDFKTMKHVNPEPPKYANLPRAANPPQHNAEKRLKPRTNAALATKGTTPTQEGEQHSVPAFAGLVDIAITLNPCLFLSMLPSAPTYDTRGLCPAAVALGRRVMGHSEARELADLADLFSKGSKPSNRAGNAAVAAKAAAMAMAHSSLAIAGQRGESARVRILDVVDDIAAGGEVSMRGEGMHGTLTARVAVDESLLTIDLGAALEEAAVADEARV